MDMNKIVRNIRRILFEDSIDIVELFGSINSLGWGMWLILHPQLFHTSTIYAVLAKFGSPQMWGLILLALGFARFVGVSLDRYRLRKTVAMLGTILWAFICASFYQQNPNAIIVFITAENTILSAWEYLRHSRRARIRKEVREEIHSTQTHV